MQTASPLRRRLSRQPFDWNRPISGFQAYQDWPSTAVTSLDFSARKQRHCCRCRQFRLSSRRSAEPMLLTCAILIHQSITQQELVVLLRLEEPELLQPLELLELERTQLGRQRRIRLCCCRMSYNRHSLKLERCKQYMSCSLALQRRMSCSLVLVCCISGMSCRSDS